MSRTGLGLAVVYVALSVACVFRGLRLEDPEESTVLMQLPVLPAALVLGALGAFGLLERFADGSLIVLYAVLIPAIAAALYLACWLVEALGPRTRPVLAAGALGVVTAALFWPVRR